MYTPAPAKVNKKFVPITQARFPKGYVSLLTDSRIPPDALASMYNMTLEQDSVPRPRPPFMPYGAAFLGTCIGIGKYTSWAAGVPTYYEISMQVINGGAVVCTRHDGGSWTPIRRAVSAPGSGMTATPVSGTGLSVGNYKYQVTFVSGGGETLPGPETTATTTSANKKVDLAAIPTGTSSVTARNIYRTAVGGATGTEKLVATIADNTTTTYVDTTPDASLGVNVPTSDTSTISYNTTNWTTFTQGAQLTTTDTADNRVYISNGADYMSYYDVTSNMIVVYVGLSTPGSLVVTPSGGLAGSNYNQYYRISANNAGGESVACASVAGATSTPRDYWGTGQSIAISWGAVSGATSYNIYTSDQLGQEAYLATVSGVAFTDDGSTAINIYKLAPNNDSSAGPILSYMVNIDNALYGVGDINNPAYLWYSGNGQHFGDFSFNPLGGGYLGIDYGGDTTPTSPFPFHDGKGNPVPSVLTSGPAGRGKLYHLQATSTQVGSGNTSTTLTYFNVYEASAQDGCPSQRGVALYNNNAYYCTGSAFKTTGIQPNIINILSTDTISNQILDDVQDLNLAALNGYVQVEWLGKIYFAVPTGDSGGNNEIWVLDMTRGGLWILRWVLATTGFIEHLWMYQDNSGIPHLNLLQNNIVLSLDLPRDFTPTQDNGTPFNTLLRTGAMVFDSGGVAEVSSYFTYFKYLFPQGEITENIYGLTEDNVNGQIVTNTLNLEADSTLLVWGELMYSNPNGSSVFSGDTGSGNAMPGPIEYTTAPTYVDPLEVDEIVSEQTAEIQTSVAGCDYLLSSITTTVYSIPRRYASNT